MSFPETTVRLRTGARASVPSGRQVRVELRENPWAELRIYGAAATVRALPDTFILHDDAATSPRDAIYWCEVKMEDAATTRVRKGVAGNVVPFTPPAPPPLSGESSDEPALTPLPTHVFRHETLVFDQEPGEGKTVRLDEITDDLTYTLRHRPAGTEVGERIVFRERADVFTHSPTDTKGGVGIEVPDEPSMGGFAVTKCYLSDEVSFPADYAAAHEVPAGAEMGGPGAPPEASGEGAGPAGDGSDAPAPAAIGSAEPQGLRARAWAAGTPCPHALESTGSPFLLDAVAALAGAETWVTLFASGADGDGPDEARLPEFLGVWQATTDGTYAFATYDTAPLPGASSASPEAPPTLAETTASHVLVQTGKVLSPTQTVFAYVSPFPLPWTRAQAIAEGLLASTLAGELEDPERADGLIPFFARASAFPDGDEVFERQGSHVIWEDSEWKLCMPDPIRTPIRLAREAERATRRYEDWMVVASTPHLNATLLGTVAYGENHRREYLDDLLVQSSTTETVGTYGYGYGYGGHIRTVPNPATSQVIAWSNSRGEWASDPPEIAAAPQRIDSELQHFLYGHHYQKEYLRHGVLETGSRLAAWMGWSADPTRRDLLSVLDASAPEAEPLAAYAEAARALNEALFECDGAMVDAGCGGRTLVRRAQETPLLDSFDGVAPEAVPAIVSEAIGAEDPTGPVADAIRATPFKVTWKLAKKGAKPALKFLQTLPPLLLSERYGRTVVRTRFASTTWFAFLADFAWRIGNVTDDAPAITHTPEAVQAGWVRFRTTSSETVTRRGSVLFGAVDLMRTEETTRVRRYFDRGVFFGGLVDTLAIASVTVNLWTLGADIRDGKMGRSQAITAGKALADMGDFVLEVHKRSTARGGRVARGAARVAARSPLAGRIAGKVAFFFKKAARPLDAAAAADKSIKAITREAPLGARDVSNVDELKVVGALVELAGCLVVGVKGVTAAAAVTLGVSVGWAIVIGVALIALGLALIELGKVVERLWRRGEDPLSWWIPLESVWGKEPKPGGFWGGGFIKMVEAPTPEVAWTPENLAANADARARFPEQRRRLIQLVSPGGDLSVISASGEGADRQVRIGLGTPDPMMAQTESLLKKGFAFPTTVGRVARDREGRVAGFALDVEARFIPTSGVLLVSGEVVRIGTAPIPVQCVLRYERTEDGYRYRASAPTAPPVPGQTYVRSNGWATARVDGDDRVFFRIHIHGASSAWQLRELSDLDLSDDGIRSAQRTLGLKPSPIVSPIGALLYGQIMGDEMEAARDALQEASVRVPGDSVLTVQGREGRALSRSLRTGRFTVRGRVYFQPLAPHATPYTDAFPGPSDEPPLTAFEDIGGSERGFIYPDNGP